MGVKNLHKFIETIVKKYNLSEINGETVAIDASSLLHKAFILNPTGIAKQQHNKKLMGVMLK